VSAGADARIRPAAVDEAVEIFCDAFAEYPVMRYVLGEHDDYPARLRRLNYLWTMEAALQAQPMYAVEMEGQAAACATLFMPGDGAAGRESADGADSPKRLSVPSELAELSEDSWQRLGMASRSRYETYSVAARRVHAPEPSIYIDMLGVRRAYQGLGLARVLTDHVHALSLATPASTGVALTTENAANVAFYEHLGYRVVGHEQVGRTLETWGFYRPDPT
jgi:ribosomal protein S18 acetylase RimI-like enzyme